MKTITLKRLTHFFTLSVSILAYTTAANAQTFNPSTSMDEPARWTQEDITYEQKLSTATKEAVNAQQQFIDECKILPASQSTLCIADARMNYKNEMADISKRFGIGATVIK